MIMISISIAPWSVQHCVQIDDDQKREKERTRHGKKKVMQSKAKRSRSSPHSSK